MRNNLRYLRFLALTCAALIFGCFGLKADLKYGDVVKIKSKVGKRYLTAADGKVIKGKVSSGPTVNWKLINPNDRDSRDICKKGGLVILQNLATRTFLSVAGGNVGLGPDYPPYVVWKVDARTPDYAVTISYPDIVGFESHNKKWLRAELKPKKFKAFKKKKFTVTEKVLLASKWKGQEEWYFEPGDPGLVPPGQIIPPVVKPLTGYPPFIKPILPPPFLPPIVGPGGVQQKVSVPRDFVRDANASGVIVAAAGLTKDGKTDIWVINNQKEIWRREEISASMESGESSRWKKMPGRAIWISMGSGGIVCAIDPNGRAWKWNASTNGWVMLPESEQLSMICAVGEGDYWVLTSDGDLLQLGKEEKWVNRRRGQVAYVDASPDGTVLCIDKDDGNVYKWLSGQEWSSIWTVKLDKVTVCKKGKYYGLKHGSLFVLEDDVWAQVPNTRGIIKLDMNAKGDVVLVGADGMVYIRKGSEEIAVTKPGDAKVPEASLEDRIKKALEEKSSEGAVRTPQEKIIALTSVVEWAAKENKTFTGDIPTKQAAFVTGQVLALYNQIGIFPKEYPGMSELLYLFNITKSYAPLVGVFGGMIETSMIKPLVDKGVKAPAIMIRPDAKFSDIIASAKLQPAITRADQYKAIAEWVLTGKALTPAEQSEFMWQCIYVLYNEIKSLPKEAPELSKLLDLAIFLQDKAPVMGAMLPAVKTSIIDPLTTYGVKPTAVVAAKTEEKPAEKPAVTTPPPPGGKAAAGRPAPTGRGAAPAGRGVAPTSRQAPVPAVTPAKPATPSTPAATPTATVKPPARR